MNAGSRELSRSQGAGFLNRSSRKALTAPMKRALISSRFFDAARSDTDEWLTSLPVRLRNDGRNCVGRKVSDSFETAVNPHIERCTEIL